jgi:hypothetical protein
MQFLLRFRYGILTAALSTTEKILAATRLVAHGSYKSEDNPKI